jgi:hypothetical protein
VPAREVQADHFVVERLGRGDGLAARVLQVELRHHLFQRDALVACLLSERARVPVVVMIAASATGSPGRDLAGAPAGRARDEAVSAGSRALAGARRAGGVAPLFVRHGGHAEARRRVKKTRRKSSFSPAARGRLTLHTLHLNESRHFARARGCLPFGTADETRDAGVGGDRAARAMR